MKTLTLYTTLGCHLCEDAKRVIWEVIPTAGYQLEEVDIADSDALMTLYGTRIPVVRRSNPGSELGWPFAAAELEAFLSG